MSHTHLASPSLQSQTHRRAAMSFGKRSGEGARRSDPLLSNNLNGPYDPRKPIVKRDDDDNGPPSQPPPRRAPAPRRPTQAIPAANSRAAKAFSSDGAIHHHHHASPPQQQPKAASQGSMLVRGRGGGPRGGARGRGTATRGRGARPLPSIDRRFENIRKPPPQRSRRFSITLTKNTPRREARVINGYLAEGDSELSLRPGEIVILVAMDDNVSGNRKHGGYWAGKKGNQIGSFPKECVELIVASPSSGTTSVAPASSLSSSSPAISGSSSPPSTGVSSSIPAATTTSASSPTLSPASASSSLPSSGRRLPSHPKSHRDTLPPSHEPPTPATSYPNPRSSKSSIAGSLSTSLSHVPTPLSTSPPSSSFFSSPSVSSPCLITSPPRQRRAAPQRPTTRTAPQQQQQPQPQPSTSPRQLPSIPTKLSSSPPLSPALSPKMPPPRSPSLTASASSPAVSPRAVAAVAVAVALGGSGGGGGGSGGSGGAAAAGGGSATPIATAALKDLTPQDHRGLVIEEIINTEEQYVKDLEIIGCVFMFPIESLGIVSDNDYKGLFSNLNNLLPMHQKIMDDLVQAREQETMGGSSSAIAKAFANISNYLKMYAMYCSNHATAIETLERLQQNSSFVNFLRICETDTRLNNQPLSSFLIKPIQRICKYPLLLRELIRWTDKCTSCSQEEKDLLRDTDDRINAVVKDVNEGKRGAEALKKVIDVQNSVEGLKGDWLVQPGRMLTREGAAGLVEEGLFKSSVVESYVFLFNDLIIVVRKSGKRGKKWEQRRRVSLSDAKLINISDTEGLKYAFEVCTTNKNGKSKERFTLTFGAEPEKNDWMKGIKSLIKDFQRKKLLELKKELKSKADNTSPSLMSRPHPNTPPLRQSSSVASSMVSPRMMKRPPPLSASRSSGQRSRRLSMEMK